MQKGNEIRKVIGNYLNGFIKENRDPPDPDFAYRTLIPCLADNGCLCLSDEFSPVYKEMVDEQSAF